MHIDDADAGGSLKPYKIDCLTMARWWATIIKEHQILWQYHAAMVICVVSCRGCVHWRDLLHEHTMVSVVLFAKMTRIDRTNAGDKNMKNQISWRYRAAMVTCVVLCIVGLVWQILLRDRHRVSINLFWKKMRTNYWPLITHYWRFSLAFGVLRSRVWRDMAVAQRKH